MAMLQGNGSLVNKKHINNGVNVQANEVTVIARKIGKTHRFMYVLSE